MVVTSLWLLHLYGCYITVNSYHTGVEEQYYPLEEQQSGKFLSRSPLSGYTHHN